MTRSGQWLLVSALVLTVIVTSLYLFSAQTMQKEYTSMNLTEKIQQLSNLEHPTHELIEEILAVTLETVESPNSIFTSYELSVPNECFRHVAFRGEPSAGSGATARGILIITLHSSCYFDLNIFEGTFGTDSELHIPYPKGGVEKRNVTTNIYKKNQLKFFITFTKEKKVTAFTIQYNGAPRF